MTEEEKKQKQLEDEAKRLTDIDIAELANKELKKKEAENASLRKQLAQSKLYSTAEDEDIAPLSREECIKNLNNSHITNYDYAVSVVDLVDCEKSSGRANPLGGNGEDVYKFFKNVIEECDGDKNRFTSIYQSRLSSDDSQIAMAYRNRNN